MAKPHVVILGAGPAGLGAAFQLSKRGLARVTVLEESCSVGGIAGSHQIEGFRVDYGSHRLHPACAPEVLGDIRALLGDDLLDRPRHGRIRLRGRWVHFPLRPFDLALNLPPDFAMGVVTDIALKPLRSKDKSHERHSFSSVLEAGLGRTVCREFYFPYARKLWGLEPDELSVRQARRRVSAGSLGKMARKILSSVPGFKAKGSGHFFYPREGFGQITEAYYRAAVSTGADVRLKCHPLRVHLENGKVRCLSYTSEGRVSSLPLDFLWSTIPITCLVDYLKPEPPEEVLAAAQNIDYRSMLLVYLVLEQARFSEYDAHYFPEPTIPISRLSEPRNYGDGGGERDLTVLCAELPCAVDGKEWNKADHELGHLVCEALDLAGIPVKVPISSIHVRRIRRAYPIYSQGYEAHFDVLDGWLGQINGLLTFGRQGLFTHDNVHHALSMAYSAVECLDEGGHFDSGRWQRMRHVFESYVVED